MARPGPGNGWRADERLGQAELAAELAHLVLEQFAQRLDQLHVHPLGQAADIVVALDRHARPAGEADALDHVRIERALGEEIGAADLARLVLEHVDEGLADELALGLGVGDAGEPAEEILARVHVDQRDVVAVAEQARRPARPRPSRISPWSTNTQVSCSPIASWISTAATALSTPPDSPQITLPLPTCSRMSAILASRKAPIVQSPAQPHTWRTKLASSLPPSGVCTTSGWNIVE